MAMRFNDKADIIAGLRKAIGDDRPLFGKESPDGKYIPARIAFEENSPEEKERLKKAYAYDEAVENEKKKIIRDSLQEQKLKEALDRRNLSGSRRTSIRSGEQFYTK